MLPGSRSEPAGAAAFGRTGTTLVATGVLRATADQLISRGFRVSVLGGRTLAFSTRTAGAWRVHLRVAAIPAVRRGHRLVLAVAESLHDADNAVHRALVLLLVGGAGALALVALGGWWIARRALRPVELMTNRAQEIGIDDLSQRVAVPKVRDELAHLDETLNAMRTELEVSLRQDTLEPAARRTLELVLADAIRLGRIVDNLLVLARIDEGRLGLLKRSEDLYELVDRIVRAHQTAANAAGVRLSVAGEHVRAEVDRDRLEQVLRNLLENAIRYAPVDSVVAVQIWQQRAMAELSVSDSGPGIERGQRERVFERFSREDKAPRRAPQSADAAVNRDIRGAEAGPRVSGGPRRLTATTCHAGRQVISENGGTHGSLVAAREGRSDHRRCAWDRGCDCASAGAPGRPTGAGGLGHRGAGRHGTEHLAGAPDDRA